MATSKVVDAAIDDALAKASVDHDSAEAERVTFDPRTLDRLKALMKESGGPARVRDAWRHAIRTAIDDLDGDRALAALVLSDRLRGAPNRSYRASADGSWILSSAAAEPDDDFWSVVPN
jgi:hypothetical protein